MIVLLSYSVHVCRPSCNVSHLCVPTESTGPAKVVRAGNPPKARRGGKVILFMRLSVLNVKQWAVKGFIIITSSKRINMAQFVFKNLEGKFSAFKIQIVLTGICPKGN